MSGLEHKDERLHAADGADWRDALAVKRRELAAAARDDDRPGEDAEQAAPTTATGT